VFPGVVAFVFAIARGCDVAHLAVERKGPWFITLLSGVGVDDVALEHRLRNALA
jgi:hypothetical protein